MFVMHMYYVLININRGYIKTVPISVTVQSKVWVYSCSLAGIVGSNPARGMDVCLCWLLCCQVEVSAMSWSLIQRSPTDCDASLCVI